MATFSCSGVDTSWGDRPSVHESFAAGSTDRPCPGGTNSCCCWCRCHRVAGNDGWAEDEEVPAAHGHQERKSPRFPQPWSCIRPSFQKFPAVSWFNFSMDKQVKQSGQWEPLSLVGLRVSVVETSVVLCLMNYLFCLVLLQLVLFTGFSNCFLSESRRQWPPFHLAGTSQFQ